MGKTHSRNVWDDANPNGWDGTGLAASRSLAALILRVVRVLGGAGVSLQPPQETLEYYLPPAYKYTVVSCKRETTEVFTYI